MSVKKEILNAEMQRIYDRDGDVTVTAVIEAATPEDSPIHSLLEWDDAKGAAENRARQARGLIRRADIVDAGEIQKLINVPPSSIERITSPEGAYLPSTQIIKEVGACDRALNQLLSHIHGIQLLVDELQRHVKGDDQLEQLSLLRSALVTAESLSKAMVAH